MNKYYVVYKWLATSIRMDFLISFCSGHFILEFPLLQQLQLDDDDDGMTNFSRDNWSCQDYMNQ